MRNAKEIARLEESAFAMAKGAKLPAEHVAVIGRVAEGDGTLQEALVKEFSDRKPPNAAQAEAMARMFKEDRTENESTTDLFGEQEVATSFYRERARIIDGTIRRLKQDKRVFATLGQHAEQIEEAGNVLGGENVAIAESSGQCGVPSATIGYSNRPSVGCGQGSRRRRHITQETTRKPSAKSLPQSRNGLRKEVAQWASDLVRKERLLRKNGSLARMHQEAQMKRRAVRSNLPKKI